MALIPPFFLHTVVAIGNRDSSGSVAWSATGFMLGTPIVESENQYNVYLVTNRHVVETLEQPVIRMNPIGLDPARVIDISVRDAEGKLTWSFHPSDDIDVAVTSINYGHNVLQDIEKTFFSSDKHTLTTPAMRDTGLGEASRVVVLGFPMGIVGDVRNAVLVRSGSIARIRDLYEGNSRKFLIDATVLPGNSGGPVVQLVETVAIEGTTSQPKSHLIGIVAEYLAYSDIAISQQTKRPRVSFEENSGLATVFPVELILETIQDWVNNHVAANQ
jgi:S1-C subfamily serine protease